MKDPCFGDVVTLKTLDHKKVTARVCAIDPDDGRTRWDWRVIVLQFQDDQYNDNALNARRPGFRELYMHAFNACRVTAAKESGT